METNMIINKFCPFQPRTDKFIKKAPIDKFTVDGSYHDMKITYEFVPYCALHDLHVKIESSLFKPFNLVEEDSKIKISKEYLPTREEFNRGYILDQTFIIVKNTDGELVEMICKTVNLKIKIC